MKTGSRGLAGQGCSSLFTNAAGGGALGALGGSVTNPRVDDLRKPAGVSSDPLLSLEKE